MSSSRFAGGFRLKRLAVLIAVPTLIALVLLVALWKTFFLYVPPGKMLVVISKSGDVLQEHQVLADPGEKGILRTVRGEGWHFVLPIVYTTELKDNIVINPGRVGIVTSKGGTPMQANRVVEDGERGIRREILLPGSYRLNPYGFDVKEVPMVRIDPGFIGVLRRKLTNKDGGDMGILTDRVLQPGIYPLNTEEFEVISCDVGVYQTTYQYTTGRDSTAITFPAKDANTIQLDCTIEWEVKPQFWSAWVTKFGTTDRAPGKDVGPAVPTKAGDLKNIERLVIDQHVRKICRDRGLNYGAQDFLDGEKREKFQEDFRKELDTVCKEDNVVVRSAFLRNIIIPDRFLEQKRLEQLAVENRQTSEALTLTAATLGDVKRTQQTIELEVSKVRAETGRMVSVIEQETENLKSVTDAEIERLKDEYSAMIQELDTARERTLGEAEAKAKGAKEKAEASIFAMRMNLFGKDGDAYLRYSMAKEMNPALRLRLFQSGPGTLWTNMGDKGVNLFVPLPPADAKKEQTPRK